MKKLPQVAVVVISYNTRELLLESLASVIDNQKDFAVELIVVDNASQDGSLEAVRYTYPQALTIGNEKNLGFGAACNQAIKATSAPFILLLNSDARLTAKTLPALYDCLRLKARCGAAGCRVVNVQGQEVSSTRYFLGPFNQALELIGMQKVLPWRYFCRTQRPRPDKDLLDCSIDWIAGACLMLRRAALDEVGLFDERFFMYSEDEDLCYRLKERLWSVCFSAAATVVHHGGASSAKEKRQMVDHFYASQMRFLRKHSSRTAAWFYKQATKIALMVKRVGLAGERQGDEYDEHFIAFKRACARVSETSREV